ncbi:MAG: Cof-type HAD-IIB family hydrolase [Cytophagaceae bacterium]
MSTYKMIVLDMDDTLLTDHHTISDRNKQALLAAQEKGIYVVLASGRPTPAMTTYAKDLQLDEYKSHIISFNGAVITDMHSGEDWFTQSLSVEDIHQLYDYSKEFKVDIITYLDGQIISERDSNYIGVEKKITGMPLKKVSNFKTAVDRSAIKCILLEEPNYLKEVEAELKKLLPHKSIATSKPFFLEVTQHGIDKAASLDKLAKSLHISPSEIIAVGNAGNDLSMVQYAGMGVWVDNVTPELRHLADLIVASNNDDGVAEVVEKFLL